jgi:predicted SnoaL-like aldol condensation-catalyzing enzyme
MNNKEIVGTFLGAVAKQDTETMRKFANADYIQHNPFVPTGLEPFIGLLTCFKGTRNLCRKREDVSRW